MGQLTPYRGWIALGSIFGFASFYLAAEFLGWPLLYYHPVQERWWFGATPPDTLHMAYWGLVLWGFVGAIAAGITARIAASVVPRSPHGLPILAAWALAAVALCGGYFFYNLWPL